MDTFTATAGPAAPSGESKPRLVSGAQHPWGHGSGGNTGNSWGPALSPESVPIGTSSTSVTGATAWVVDVTSSGTLDGAEAFFEVPLTPLDVDTMRRRAMGVSSLVETVESSPVRRTSTPATAATTTIGARKASCRGDIERTAAHSRPIVSPTVERRRSITGYVTVGAVVTKPT